MSAAIKVSVRELHARTGHYIRKAAEAQRIIVTDHGHPLVELIPVQATSSIPFFARRTLRPAFKKMLDQGKFRLRPQDRDVTDLISDDRD